MSFFTYIFGKPQAPPQPQAKEEEAPSHTKTIASLQEQEKQLEKKIDYTRVRITHLVEQAKDALTKNDKPKALMLLKQKGMLEEQEKSFTAMLDKLSHQRLTVELGIMQHETLKTMKQTNAYLKQTEGKIDADKAQDIVDGYDDHVQTQNDITRILAEPLPGTSHLQDEAEAELAKLMAAEQPVAAPVNKKKEDDEIAELLAMMPQAPTTTTPASILPASAERSALAM